MGAKQLMIMTVPRFNESILFPAGQNKIEYFKSLTRQSWLNEALKVDKLIFNIDKYITRSKYWKSNYLEWKFNDGFLDNDVSVHQIQANTSFFSFRCDMYERDHTFLKNMLSLCRHFGLTVYGLNGLCTTPEYTKVIEEIAGPNFISGVE